MSDERSLRGVAQQAYSSCGDEGTLHDLYEGLVSWGGIFLVIFFVAEDKEVTRQLAKLMLKVNS